MLSIDELSLSREVSGFLAEAPLKSFVGGAWVESSGGQLFATVDPGSGIKLADVFAMQSCDVEAGVAAGERAFRESGWPNMTPAERAAHLRRLADLIDAKADVMAELEALDCGKLRANSPLDIMVFCRTLRYYADLAEKAEYSTPLELDDEHEGRIARLPYGVCGFIYPWNFPFWLLGWGIIPAMAAGNTVVVKPAEDSPLTTLYLGRLMEEAGIPAGVYNVVAGYGEPAGAALTRDPRLKRMSFTGSPEVGKLIGAACGGNLVPVKLELGGKGAAVVFEDVDIEDTAEKLAMAITFRAGQLCCDCTRWIVQKSIYTEFVEAVREKLAAVRVGHGFDPDAGMGPLINAAQRTRVLSYMEKGLNDGAQAILPGGACTVPGCEGGFYVRPGLLAGSLDNVAAQEEIFGPVAFLANFRNEAEAVELANCTPYGLANSVWSADLDRCNRVAEAMVAGTSWINAHNVFPAGAPFSGINLSGMGGGTNSVETFYDYLRPLTIVRPL